MDPFSIHVASLRQTPPHLVVSALGVSRVAKTAGFSRVSLYRMLTAGGNPRLKNLLALLAALGLRFWIVDEEFIARRLKITRAKDQNYEPIPEYLLGNTPSWADAHENMVLPRKRKYR